MVSPAAGSLPKGNTASAEETLIHVLYVDNEAGLLKAAKPILEMQGSFHVETASSVEEAMKKMEAKTFDVIVCDYIMPGKDGLEFLKELRDSGNSIPFIIFTGKGREIVAIKALNLGADQYINKIGKTEAVYSELAHGIRTVVKGKKAEEALKDSEKEKSAVLDSMSELVIHQDLKHRILWTNKKAADSVNMKAEQLKGHYCHELWAKSAKPCAACPIEETIKTGQPQQGEITTPDGRIWSISGYPIKDANGKVTSIVEVTTEITMQKKAEEALRESEKRFRELSELLPEVIFETDSKRALKFVNHAAHIKFGYSLEEFDSGLNALQMLVPEDRKRAEENIERILRGEKIGSNEYTALRKDGTTFPIIINSTPIIRGNRAVGLRGIMVDITKHKLAEKALQESEEKYRLMVEQAPDSIITFGLNGVVTSCNAASVAISGYSKEDVVGKHFSELRSLIEEDIQKFRKLLDSLLEGKAPEPFEIVYLNKNGTSAFGEVHISLMKENEKITGFQAIMRDVTKHKKAEEALRESEEKFRNLAEKSPNMIFINKKGRVIYANKRCEEIMGYKKEDYYSPDFNFFTLIAPESKEQLKSSYSRHLKGEEILPYEYTLITKEEKRIEAILTSKLITYEGEPAILGIICDITEHKKTSEKLKESERKYRLLTENITDVIYIQDMNLRVTYASPSVEKISGYTPEELLKLRPENFMTPESFEQGVADFKEAITSAAEEPDYEIPLKQYEYVRKDGSTFWGELKMKLLRDSNNNLVGFQGTLRDITERKEAEKKLDEMMNALVTINEKLGVVGRLTRHDARNKLSVIANNVYLAKQKLPANHNSLEFLGDIESAIDQMDKIFDFARTYEMLGVEELSHMDVGKSVDEAAILLSGMNDVKLVNECQGLTVMADSLLRQLFYNLIDNTLKYGEKVSQIRVHYIEGEDQLKLVYEDDGVGIPENEKEKLFKEGYGKSTGYGLYLIKKICEAYGWTIRETGKQGKGAQFTMTIPKTTKNGKKSYIID